jgi:hypothetical protein
MCRIKTTVGTGTVITYYIHDRWVTVSYFNEKYVTMYSKSLEIAAKIHLDLCADIQQKIASQDLEFEDAMSKHFFANEMQYW